VHVFSFFGFLGARRLTFLSALLALLVPWSAVPPAAKAQAMPGAMYFTVTPCRLADSRLSTPLVSGTVYAVTPAAGPCGIPSGAAAVALNLVVVKPTSSGYLTLYSGATVPTTSTTNFQTGQIRANNAIVPLDALGNFNVLGTLGGGTYDLVIDTAGYFVALPKGVDDSYSASENTPLVVPAPGVLGNDIGTNLQAVAFLGATAHGTVNLLADGAFLYTPTAGYAGSDAFTYTVQNAAGSATANVTLTICPPLSITPASPATPIYQVFYNQHLTGVGGTGPYTFTLASGALPAGLSIVGTALTGTPTSTGLFNFSLTVTDANGCSTTQAFSVTARPNAQNDTFVSHAVGNTQFVVNTAAPATPAVFVNSATGVLGNDNGPGSLSASGAVVGGIGGTVLLNVNGTFTYTPPVNTTGTATFTYILTDGNGITNTAMATIVVDAPVVWYVDNATAAGTNDGRSNTPFKTMTAVGGAATSNGDFIYVAKGSGNTTGTYAMKPSQQLIGAGATLTVGALSVPGNAANTPMLSGTLTLANSVAVKGIDMSTGSSRAITNFNGATYDTITGVSVTARTIASTTGTAIDIQGTGNTGTMAFTSVSASGASSGIIVTNFTGGSFTVLGAGSAGSGGTIQNSTGDGIVLTNLNSPSLNWMNISDSGGAATDDGIVMTNITGTVTIANCAIANSPHNGMTVDNNNTNMAGFNFTNNAISCAAGQPCQPSGSLGNDGLLLQMRGTSVLTSGLVSASTFSGVRAVGVQIQTNDSGRIGSNSGGTITNSFTIQTSTFTNNGVAIDIDESQVSNLTFQILNNVNITGTNAVAINAFTTAGADTGPVSHSFVGRIDGNVIGTQGTKDSGSRIGSGIRVVVQGQNTQGNVAVDNNVIREVVNADIMTFIGQNGAAASGTGTARFKITNNSMPAPSGSNQSLCGPPNTPCAGAGIFVLADEGYSVCTVITGNAIYDVTTMLGDFDVYLAERSGPPPGAQLTVEGTGATTTFINANNTLAGASKSLDEGGNTSTVPAGSCGTFP
jgi:Big-like domain-containing protein/putative Ig domain-containing protein/cadherin-like protein